MVKTHLLVIDGQNDFCTPSAKVLKDPNDPNSGYISKAASLYVNGANEDMKKLAVFISKNKHKFYDIHATLDSHHMFQVFHPLFWRNAKGEHPAPFTRITQDDIEKGIWFPAVPSMRDRMIEYTKTLATNNRYMLIIWPPHCLIGSWGTQVHEDLWNAFTEWELETTAMVDYVTKGSNMYTEHYSAVKAEVPDPADASTQLNTALIDMLMTADVILVAGEALDYCVANTLRDIVSAFGPDNARKIKILEDCTSAIDPTSIPKLKAEFTSYGVEFVDTTYFEH